MGPRFAVNIGAPVVQGAGLGVQFGAALNLSDAAVHVLVEGAPTAETAIGAARPASLARAPLPDVDVRGAHPQGIAPSVLAARTALRRRLGAEAVVTTDPVAGGARVVQRTDGLLDRRRRPRGRRRFGRGKPARDIAERARGHGREREPAENEHRRTLPGER